MGVCFAEKMEMIEFIMGYMRTLSKEIERLSVYQSVAFKGFKFMHMFCFLSAARLLLDASALGCFERRKKKKTQND